MNKKTIHIMVKSKVLKIGCGEQWRYAWVNTLGDMFRKPLATSLTITVIAISITLPSLFYIFWKNALQASQKWYPRPQLTVFFDKLLNKQGIEQTVANLSQLHGIKSAHYLSREEVMIEFRNWAGFASALDLLEENSFPAVVIVTPKIDFPSLQSLNNLRNKINKLPGIEDVRMDDNWFIRLVSLTGLIRQLAFIIGILMVIAVFLVIGNSIRLDICAHIDTINVMKLIGATDGFIMRPFLNGGIIIGFFGALLSLILSAFIIWQLTDIVARVAGVFGTTFHIQWLFWDEVLLVLLVTIMISWLSAWCATVQHLRYLTQE
ncbi:MAG: permease-like cell division protein FtsX [Candidatus Arsenophonus melophagi]|nr:permease-like cell division protein FtsX [Candidatus Arsenophonus melophagi]